MSSSLTQSASARPLDSHSAPVWQISWAHPSFGPILASASYDGKVFIWKEKGRAALGNPVAASGAAKGAAGGKAGAGEKWEVIKEHSLHNASGESRMKPRNVTCDVGHPSFRVRALWLE